MSKSEREAELEDRVDELEDTVKKMLPGRREVLAGSAVAGAGLLGFGAGTASADGHNDGDTQWGKDSNRDDYVVDHLDANSIGADEMSGKQIDNVYHATSFSGTNGGDQIQSAINEADSTSGRNTVVVGPVGPDTNARWDLSSPIDIPSETTLVLHDCYLFLTGGADSNILKNADTTNGNANITVHGIGDPVIDGNGANQTRQTDEWLNVGLRFYDVDGLNVRNITIRETNHWGLKPEACSNVRVQNIEFDQNASTANQDGVHPVGPGDNIHISDITGVSGDDMIALSAESSSNAIEGSGGNLSNITVQTVNGSGLGAEGLIRLIAGDGDQLYDVDISGVVNKQALDNGAPVSSSRVVAIGWDGVGTLPAPEDLRNITLRGLHVENVEMAVNFETDCSNITITDATLEGYINKGLNQTTTGTTIDTLTFSDVTFDSTTSDGTPNGSILNLQETVKNLQAHNVTVRNAKYGFYMSGATADGLASNWVVDTLNTNGGLYPYVSNIKFTGDMPAFDSAPGAVKGSEVIASASWDPDGDGNGERVLYDGSAWQEVVDLPNW